MRLVVSSMTGQLVYLFLNIEYIYIYRIDRWMYMNGRSYAYNVQMNKKTQQWICVWCECTLYIYIFEAEWRKHTNEQLFSLCFTFIFVKIFFAWSCDCHTASEKESTCSSVRKWANKLKRK